MEEGSGNKSESVTYRERVRYHRMGNQHIHQIFRYLKSSDLSLKEKFWKSYKELALSYHAVKDIFKEVLRYGSIIKRAYGRTKIVQFFQQAYLKFGIGVKIDNYRYYLLFKSDRWKQVKAFTFKNEDVEQDFIAMSVPGSKGIYKHEYDIFKDKISFYKHCLKYDIPTPPILVTINLNENNVSAENLILPGEDIFIKPIDSACSFGAAKFFYRNQRFEDIEGKAFSSGDFIEFLSNREYNSNHDRKGVFIVQPVFKNHEDWKPLTSGALTTCRILTGRALDSEHIIPMAAALRMPTGSAIVDNFSAGGIASPVNMKTGELGTAVTHLPKNGVFEFEKHPDTGQQLKGTFLPHWDKLVGFTKEVHKTFDFTFVGWDIAYTPQGFIVVEGNGIWSCSVLETVYNRPLSTTRYPELFNQWMEHFQNKTNRDTVEIS